MHPHTGSEFEMGRKKASPELLRNGERQTKAKDSAWAFVLCSAPMASPV